ncbi:MAG: hypothetical protein JWP52_3151 [Rhizobacter sp.]|nr:hypothetical protein [Rhizobacter sp.]
MRWPARAEDPGTMRKSPTRATATARGAAVAEWQTWALIAAVYGGWLLAAWHADALGKPLASIALMFMACWFMSLQHELLHGHPTRSRFVNRLLGLLPLAVWYPYDLYRQSHLAHHQDELLTQPGIDPESNYIHADDHARLPACLRWMWVAQRTVIGRVVLGPAMVIVPTWLDIVRRPWRGDFTQTRLWAQHLLLLAALLWALDRYAGIGPLHYMLVVGYPALGLAMLRSFYEHRPSADPAHRVVINEAGWFWRLLYLNNNYHAVHHELPSLPWYLIRKHYLVERDAILRRNGGFLLSGYAELLQRYAVEPVDSPVHPPHHP